MPNRGIYGNVGLQKHYLKSFYIEKKQVSAKRLKVAVQPCMEWILIKRKCNMYLFSHTANTCMWPGIQILINIYNNKLQVLQNKCIYVCIRFNNREKVVTEHFDMINWFPIDRRFKQCLFTTVFKFFSGMCLQHLKEIYKAFNQNNNVTRNSSLKLFQLLKNKTLIQKCLSYLGPFVCNGLPDDVKLSSNVHIFKN